MRKMTVEKSVCRNPDMITHGLAIGFGPFQNGEDHEPSRVCCLAGGGCYSGITMSLASFAAASGAIHLTRAMKFTSAGPSALALNMFRSVVRTLAWVAAYFSCSSR